MSWCRVRHVSDEKKNPTDVVSLGPMLPDGNVFYTRSKTTDEGVKVEHGFGSFTPLSGPEEGQEGMLLHHLRDNHYEVVQSGKGPAKVNNAAFRGNWETIFGQRQAVGEA